MLFGTSLLFRISYFFTSFAPALFILSLKAPTPFTKNEIKGNELGSTLVLKIWPFLPSTIIVVIALFSIWYIKGYLLRRQQDKQYEIKNLVLNFDMVKKRIRGGHVIQVQEGVKINSGFIQFATSVVAPSVVLSLLKDNEMLISALIILMFFILLMLSNDVFPNIVLPLFGVQLMVTKDGYNLFYFTKDSDFLTGTKKVNSLGNTGSLARTYVITDTEFLGEEVEVVNDN